MNSLHKPHFERAHKLKQRGVVLFFALIALLALSLAAVALIRSVDTSTIIAGNLAFKQSAANSGDAGIEAGIAWLNATQASSTGLNVFTDATHPFNVTDLVARKGYHANVNPALNLTADATWDDANNRVLPEDSSGNTVRYIIQRMCRNTGPIQTANCLFGVDPANPNPTNVPLPSDICEGAGCPPSGRSPQFRITARTNGPRNSITYVQAFVN